MHRKQNASLLLENPLFVISLCYNDILWAAANNNSRTLFIL